MAISDLFKNVNIFGAGLPAGSGGLLTKEQQEQLANQSLVQGLLGTAASYLAQPKTGRYGSALPYLGKAYLGGMQASQDAYTNALNRAYQTQALAQRSKSQTQIDAGDRILLLNQAGEVEQVIPKGVVPGKSEGTKTTTVQNLEKLQEINKQLQENPNDPSLLDAKRALEVALFLQPKAQEPLTTAEKITESLTAADLERDKKLINELKSFETNEFSGITKNISQLDSAINALKTAEDGELTGKKVGLAYDTGTLDYINPQAKSALEAVQEVVQQNLRLVLGAQFTEREGARLIERAYNPRLSHAENIARLERLKKQILDSYNQKKDMLDYYNKEGTFKGYQGPAIQDIMPKEQQQQVIEVDF